MAFVWYIFHSAGLDIFLCDGAKTGCHTITTIGTDPVGVSVIHHMLEISLSGSSEMLGLMTMTPAMQVS